METQIQKARDKIIFYKENTGAEEYNHHAMLLNSSELDSVNQEEVLVGWPIHLTNRQIKSWYVMCARGC